MLNVKSIVDAALKGIETASQFDAEAAKKEEQRKAQEKYNRESRRISGYKATVDQIYNDIVRSAQNAAEKAKSFIEMLDVVYNGVEAATEGTHVGAPQCLNAISTLRTRAVTAYNTFCNIVPGTFPSISRGNTGGYSAASPSRIRVGPEIYGAGWSVRDGNVAAIDLSRKLKQGVPAGVQSGDLDVFYAKLSEMADQLEYIGVALFQMYIDLHAIYKSYHEAQKKAIMLANQINV